MKFIIYISAFILALIITNCKDTIDETNLANLNYDIAFTSLRDGNAEIYAMNADGSSQTRLTNNKYGDWFPKWSPDGQRIAFFSEEELYVMNKDGSNRMKITTGITIDDGHPWLAWSKDGTKILTQVRTNSNITQIYRVNSDGSDQRFLIEGYYPNWISNDKIIFGGQGICLINSDGSGLTQITDGTMLDFSPVVSPELNKIVFSSFRDNDSGKASLHIMNLDGSEIKEISKKYPIIKPTFSPDNLDILIVAPQTLYGTRDIFRLDINGNNEELLVDLGDITSSPVYSSDGQKIFFSASGINGRWDIYSMNLSDRIITNLTNQSGGGYAMNDFPEWNPTR